MVDVQAERPLVHVIIEHALHEAQAATLEEQKLARLAALNQMEDAIAARLSAEAAEEEIRLLVTDIYEGERHERYQDHTAG